MVLKGRTSRNTTILGLSLKNTPIYHKFLRFSYTSNHSGQPLAVQAFALQLQNGADQRRVRTAKQNNTASRGLPSPTNCRNTAGSLRYGPNSKNKPWFGLKWKPKEYQAFWGLPIFETKPEASPRAKPACLRQATVVQCLFDLAQSSAATECAAAASWINYPQRALLALDGRSYIVGMPQRSATKQDASWGSLPPSTTISHLKHRTEALLIKTGRTISQTKMTKACRTVLHRHAP